MTSKMRTVTQREFGGPEVLQLTEADRPEPTPTEVLVRVKAAGINAVDTIVRSGDFPMLGAPPFVLGWDVSGVVEETGFGVTRFRPGDEVYGQLPWRGAHTGAYAEYVAAPSRHFARKPAGLGYAEAAALPVSALTGWQAFTEATELRAGQRVLIHAAAGGVGHLAVQIAKAKGAYVIGTASARRHAFLHELGADELVDYTVADFAGAVRDVDVVLDLVGGEYATRSVRTLRPGGVLVDLNAHRGAPASEDVARLAADANVRLTAMAVESDYAGLREIAGLVESGRLRVHVEQAIPLEDAAKAHELIESAHTAGKLVLTL